MKRLVLPANARNSNQLKVRLLSIITVGLVSVLGLAQGSSLQAQTEDAPIFEKSRLAPEIETVTATYRGQIQTYLNDERQFKIAKEQYLQLGTLTSLETAVASTKKVYQSRIEVLGTYVEYARLQVLDTEGIPLEEKTLAVSNLEVAANRVKQHQQDLASRTDRVGMAQSALEFVELLPEVEEATYHGMSLVAIGRLQTVYDKTEAVLAEIEQQPASEDAFAQGKRERAIQETKAALADVKKRLITVNASVAKSQDKASRSSLNAATKSLGSVYAGLSQVLTYLYELNRL